MTNRFLPCPELGTPLSASYDNQDIRDFLAQRRSVAKVAICDPGPTPAELNELLQIATRVPDHRRLGPWRFTVFEGVHRERFGRAAADILAHEKEDATEQELELTRGLMLRAPTVVAVISNPDTAHKTPVWEQELSCGAVCYNLLLAANAAGWAACWLSEWIAYSDGINALLGLSQTERVAGFIYIGTARHHPPERLRPDPSEKISRWSPPA